jgi:lactoylglutathione lyase
MVRVSNLEKSLNFYCNALGLKETRRIDRPEQRYTLVFIAALENPEAEIELTYNYDSETYTAGRNFGHLAFIVNNIYELCENLIQYEVVINRPPRDGRMAFVKSPDGISIELLQKGNPLELKAPWSTMENVGSW